MFFFFFFFVERWHSCTDGLGMWEASTRIDPNVCQCVFALPHRPLYAHPKRCAHPRLDHRSLKVLPGTSEYFLLLPKPSWSSIVLHMGPIMLQSTSQDCIVPQSTPEYCIVLQSPSSYLRVLPSTSACPILHQSASTA